MARVDTIETLLGDIHKLCITHQDEFNKGLSLAQISRMFNKRATRLDTTVLALLEGDPRFLVVMFDGGKRGVTAFSAEELEAMAKARAEMARETAALAEKK